MKTLKKNYVFLLIFVSAILLASCAQVVPIDECAEGITYGFLHGLWHGVIAPISFVLSLFDDDIAIYAVNNSGGWYDFGFVIGAGILFGGSGNRARRRY